MRFYDFGAIALTKIATFPGESDPTNYYQSALQLFALGDDACVVFIPPLNNTLPLNVYVVDASGKYTWYASAQFPGEAYIETIVPLGPGLFFVTMYPGRSFFLRVGNKKLNKASPIMLA
jgi:hypothetical protein